MDAGQDGLQKLGQGESRRVWMPSGAGVWVDAGNLLLRGPPAWLAETLWMPERTLFPEEYWTTSQSGWIELHAPHGARFRVLPG